MSRLSLKLSSLKSSLKLCAFVLFTLTACGGGGGGGGTAAAGDGGTTQPDPVLPPPPPNYGNDVPTRTASYCTMSGNVCPTAAEYDGTGAHHGSIGLREMGVDHAHNLGINGAGISIAVASGFIMNENNHDEFYRDRNADGDNDPSTKHGDDHIFVNGLGYRALGTDYPWECAGALCSDQAQSTGNNAATVLAARAGNGFGTGIAYNSDIIPIAVHADTMLLSERGGGYQTSRGTNQWVAAINHAKDNGAQIFVNNWVGNKRSGSNCTNTEAQYEITNCGEWANGVLNTVTGKYEQDPNDNYEWLAPLDVKDLGNIKYNHWDGSSVISLSLDAQNGIYHGVEEKEVIAWGNAIDAGMIIVTPTGGMGWNTANNTNGGLYLLGSYGLVESCCGTDDSQDGITIPSALRENKVALRAALPSLLDINHFKDSNDLTINDEAALQTAIDRIKNSGQWLASTAVYESSTDVYTIHARSNACAEAMDYCLAAPVTTSGDKNTPYPHSADAATESQHSIQYNHLSSSYVGGAAALVLQAYPNLTPAQAVTVLLETATDLGDPGTDEIYGRGMVNLVDAIPTTGDPSLSSFSTSEMKSLPVTWSQSRLTLSSAFGDGLDNDFNAAIKDNLGRYFTVRQPKIKRASMTYGLEDMMQSFTAKPSEETITISNNFAMQITSDGVSGQSLGFTHHNNASVTNALFMPAFIQSDLFGKKNETAPKMQFTHIRAASSNVGLVSHQNKIGHGFAINSMAGFGTFDTDKNFSEVSTGLSYQGKRGGLQLALGNLREYDQFLGATAEGAYSLAESTENRFMQIGMEYKIGSWQTHAEYRKMTSDISTQHDEFISFDDVISDSYQLAMYSSQIFNKRDKLSLSYEAPLAVTDGNMTQNIMEGSLGNMYQARRRERSLAVDARHVKWQLSYQTAFDRAATLQGFATLTHDENWDNHQDANNTRVMAGINKKF